MLCEKVNNLEEEYSNKFQEIEQKLNLVLVALNTAYKYLNKMDNTYEGKPNISEEKVENDKKLLECKVCEMKI